MKNYLIIYFIYVNLLFANNYGSLLLHGNCTTCHYINEHKSAPSLNHIKKIYKESFFDKKLFVEYMVTWVEKPNKEGALMDDMIKKYGLMPELAYDRETLRLIAEYIFDADLNKQSDF